METKTNVTEMQNLAKAQLEKKAEPKQEIKTEENKEHKQAALPPVVTKKIEEPPKDIMARDDGQIVGNSLQEQYRVAQYYVRSGLLPKDFDTPEKALIALQYCHSLNLKASVAIRQICIINGKPAIYGDLPLAIVRQSGALENLQEIILDKDNKEICMKNGNITSEPFACVTIAKRKNGDTIERFFTMKDAERAGLLRSNCWKMYPRDMLKYRARSQVLKDLFSDVLAGAAIAEYDYGILPDREPARTITQNDAIKHENNDIINHFLKGETK